MQNEMEIKQQQVAEQYGLTPEHGVESYADFHISRLVYHHIFNRLVTEYKDKPNVRFMEVGCFEGVSTVYFLKNMLTNPSSNIVCINPLGQEPTPENKKNGWGHNPDQDPLRRKTPKTIYEVFKGNVLDKYEDKVIFHRENSDTALRKYSSPEFDVIYLDGLHYSTAIISDLIMAWPLLKNGGYMLLDDFGMDMYESRFNLDSCFFGISSFMNIFQGQYEVVNGPNYLIALKKTVDNVFLPPSFYK